ncbi:regulatory protein ArsR [Deinococcus aerius]|uniref:Regulatory protein ArsR n=2 Tax=Deinococcus TaxID=1298 RepID=A0A2I9CSX7_9DEIO|nr:regulatory protein ArsR [Deinococcus aerius]GMA17658.1 transcriptional regulator [Deinococcus metallilatus]
MTVFPSSLRYGRDMRTASQDDVCEVACVHPEAVARVRAVQPDASCVEDATSLLKMIADPTRFRILSALNAEELCVCDLAAVVGISESAVSHQLRLLRAHRLVAFRKEGRIAYYRLLDQHITSLIGGAVDHVRE